MQVVLVVEDHDPLRRLVAHTLRPLVTPHEASTLAEANALISAQLYDGYWFDVALPDGRTTALLATIRARQPHVPIFVVTGAADGQSRARAEEVGATYVEKPTATSTIRAFGYAVLEAGPRGSRSSGTRLNISSIARSTPSAAYRELVRGATSGPLLRVPTIPDTVIVVGDLRIPLPVLDVRRVAVDDAEAACSSASNIVAVVGVGIEAALGSTIEQLRDERRELPILVLDAHVSPAHRRTLAQRGVSCAIAGTRADLDVQTRAFVDESRVEADIQRRVLDARAIDWKLSDAQAELAWLCSMILPRKRVEQFFQYRLDRCAEKVMEKLRAATFGEIGRIARG